MFGVIVLDLAYPLGTNGSYFSAFAGSTPRPARLMGWAGMTA